jgi:hypothetical protein
MKHGGMIILFRFVLCVASAVGAIFALYVWSGFPPYRRFDFEGVVALLYMAGLAANAIYLVFVGPLVAQQPLHWPFRVFRIVSLWLELKESELAAKAGKARSNSE